METTENILLVEKVKKSYRSVERRTNVLKGITFSVTQGEMVAIMGPSGCGKSTLLNLIAGLDQPDSGTIFLNGIDITKLNDKDLSNFRNKNIGIVFQSFNLLDELTVEQNIEVPMIISRVAKEKRKRRISELLDRVALQGKNKFRQNQLSGGEKQRVAIARALSNDPSILLLDEPTGDLDSNTSRKIISILKSLTRKFNRTAIIITHDDLIATEVDRVLVLSNGIIESKSIEKTKN